MMQYMRILCGLLFAALLTACGGGGGSAGTTTGSSGATTGTPTVTVSVIDAAGAASTSITVGGSFSAKAVLKDSTGAAVAGRLVTFALSNSSIATLSPDTALTDSSGVAKVTISPASVTALGAATLSASALIGSATVQGQTDFAVSSSDLALSAITVGSTSLASGGNTSLSVTAMIGGAASTGTPVNISFSASCGRINGGGASFSTTTNGSGVASAVYSAVASDGSLCSGAVTLTATSPGATPQTASVSVAVPVANAITFVSATPQQVFVAGSGALEQSVVKFKALAGSTPLPNVAISFSIQVNPGGAGLNASGSTAAVTASTDSSGEVSVTLFSGTIPGPVKVKASLVSDSSVFAESQNLTISSGPPSQKFMSLSASTFNIEGQNRDGSSATLTVRLADRQGNPVEDGTVVNFTAEGGQVASSCATAKVNGIASCSVDFVSQNPRPADGRVSVLAFASGTKDYLDANRNNSYDTGDTLTNIGDAYRDDDEDGVYDVGEFVVPRGGSGACPAAAWAFPSRASTCDTSLATTVRQQAVLLFASSTPLLTVVTNTTTTFAFTLASADHPLLPLPSGTTVAAEANDATPNNGVDCSVVKLTNTTVVNIPPTAVTSQSLITDHSVTLKDCVVGDAVDIAVTVPSGLTTEKSYSLQ